MGKKSAIANLDNTLVRIKAAIESGELVLPEYESKVECVTNLTETWSPVIKFSGEIHIGDLRGDSERATDLNNLVQLLRKCSATNNKVTVS